MDNRNTRQGSQVVPEKIWIVEDDPDIGFVLEIFLTEEGFETLLLDTAEKFNKVVTGKLPDLFLMDVMLPDGNGVELCAMLKSAPRTRQIPVLMMSAHTELDRISDCVPNGFIAKPFDLERLLKSIRDQLTNTDN